MPHLSPFLSSLLLSLSLFLSFSQGANPIEILADDGLASDNFGTSVATSLPLVVVGAYLDDVDGRSNQGSVYLYNCTSSPSPSCTQTAHLFASNGQAEHRFGSRVAISGSLVAVSGGSAVYLFSCASASSCTEQGMISSGGGPLALDGNLLVVGAPGFNSNQGAAYVYDCSNPASCSLISMITASDAAASARFGYSVGISGSLVIVGSPDKDSYNGAAYVFSCSSSSCAQQSKLSTGISYSSYGGAVGISGTKVVVGARGENIVQGAAYVYDCSNPASCSFIARIAASSVADFDGFGTSVAISGPLVAVGVDGDDVFRGSAYLFTCSASSCSETAFITRPTRNEDDSMGQLVAVSGNIVVAGVIGADISGKSGQGAAVVYFASACPAETLNGQAWPVSVPSTTVSLPCPAGYYPGTSSRQCQANSIWASVQDPCSPILLPSCPSNTYGNALWPSTFNGTTASGTCNPGYSGAPLRVCKADATWATLISNHCIQNQCAPKIEFNAEWPVTSQGLISHGTCLLGFVGSPTRACLTNGTFDTTISGSCIPSSSGSCPAEVYGNADWPETPLGSIAPGSCVAGWTGTPLRRCKVDGTWEDLINNNCVRTPCPAETANNMQWPQVNQGTTASGTCINGWIGAPTRFCNSIGQWQAVQNPCVPPTVCPAELYARANWEATQPGATANGACIGGWTGNPSRICKADGTWQDLVNNHCTRI